VAMMKLEFIFGTILIFDFVFLEKTCFMGIQAAIILSMIRKKCIRWNSCYRNLMLVK
jgi:hypothetical protein